MFEIEKIFSFEAGHVLPHHDGKCAYPHGHSYTLKVRLRSRTLIDAGPQRGMVCDFSTISDVVKPMIQTYLDHQWLNNSLNTDTPTVEFIAKWIYHHLKPQLPLLYAITLHETSSCLVTYLGENF